MSKYILDTDHISLILFNHPQVTENAAKHQIATSIVTVQELFNGWIGQINDPAQINNLPALYSKLSTTLKYLQTVEVLDFTVEADECLKNLLSANPPLRKNRLQKDMRIAAIALSLDLTVATRNRKDFELVPNLNLVDWTQ
ncbi:type II toxin-antitoxin system VapC family toxin [Chamaesiphon minutus]|uniref:Putative nucleic acid-binding protein, contains PIN domain n=1 Tax=Chamaesiphon minutus (strain ATCC 27169 / PCC 6605) TaxID=1173020 RepID=K9UIG4_CHAP6|nr:type II toxin-antitoxin system VapC family toxin [Chamaesiphon minutus]AFY94892.1 putative nucleic acid-binding protein, contains PIN domain [Chamaesiphon minutus PCC 6605]